MTAGNTPVIKYRNGIGEQWTASLTGLSGTFPGGVSDPSFVHTGPDGKTHNDVWINYTTGDGSVWWSKCHSHSSLFATNITYTFEHFHTQNGHPDHEDNVLVFMSWDRSVWAASIPASPATANLSFNVTPHP